MEIVTQLGKKEEASMKRLSDLSNRSLIRVLLAITLTASVGLHSVYRQLYKAIESSGRKVPITEDDPRRLIARYECLLPYLPEKGVVGYFGTATDEVEARRRFYIAQYALSPHLLVEGVDKAYVIYDTPEGMPGVETPHDTVTTCDANLFLLKNRLK